MKLLLTLLLVVHGGIHLMGFVKAFEISALTELHLSISRPLGVAWLACGLLFIASAVMLFAMPSWWWVAAAPALVFSQTLIGFSWSDAKFGTIANILIALPVLVALMNHAPWSFNRTFRTLAGADLSRSVAAPAPLTQADVAHLPAVVQAYLRVTGAMGRPRVENVWLRFRGDLRSGPDSAWMPSEGEQFSVFRPAHRLFLVSSTLYGLPFQALHVYQREQATMQVRALSMLDVVDARGPEMNRSETVTHLNDMCLIAPATLIDSRITWEEIDALTVRARFTHTRITVAAVLSFDGRGALVNFVSDDRSRSTDGKVYESAQWSTPVTGYGDRNGYHLPVTAEARWALPDGVFTYARFEFVDFLYNVSSAHPASR